MSNGFPYVIILWLLSIVVLLWALHQSRRRALARRELERRRRTNIGRINIDNPQTCGGCRGMGAHRRWCVNVVGLTASIRGKQSELAHNLADSVGSNSPEAANHLYAAAGLLGAQAHKAARVFQERMAKATELRDHREH